MSQASSRWVFGLDVSRKMLGIAREKLKDSSVRFVGADMHRLPFPDRSFDVVLSTWEIEMLVDPKKAVTEFLRVIKDDGYVINAFAGMLSFGITRLYSFFLKRFLIELSIGDSFQKRSTRITNACIPASPLTVTV